MEIKQVEFDSDLYRSSLTLRNEVLRIPLGLDISSVDVAEDSIHIHFVAIEKDKLVGVVVLVPHYQQHTGKLRQMATVKEARGKGYGIELVNALEEYAAENGMAEIVLHARHYAVGFYDKLGYEVYSKVFQEVDIDHYKMRKDIISKG